MKYDEKKDEKIDKVAMLTQTVAMLTEAVKHQNSVILVLANKLHIQADLPHWESKEDVDREVGPKIQACVDLMKKVYGPSETDKS